MPEIKPMPPSPTIARFPLALPRLFVLFLRSTNAAVSLCYPLRKLLTACLKVDGILLDWADGHGRVTKAVPLSLSKSSQLIDPVSPTAL